MVTTTVVESRGEVIVIDPLAPNDAGEAVWQRLAAAPPTQLVVLKPDHVRDVDWFRERYGAAAWRPALIDPDDVPSTRFAPLYPGVEVPDGVMALNAGSWGIETPVWLPDQYTLVFADALTERDGAGPRRALEQLLQLPFERVIISHGSPVHAREAYVNAFKLDPWMSDALRQWSRQIKPYRKLLRLDP